MLANTALIFGVTGQDGSYLAELLLSKGYTVYGVTRRVSTPNGIRIKHIYNDKFILLQGDVTDPFSVDRVIMKSRPSEIYNLAAQSHVRTSFDEPKHTWDVTAGGALNILNVIRDIPELIKYYQAGSSEMFGASLGTLYGSPAKSSNDFVGNAHYRQSETTPFEPRSPYAIAKLAAHHTTKLYREAYGMFTCNGILFNHESERRGEEFVTRKITKYLAALHVWMAAGYKADSFMKLKLGNCEAYRDWGYAPDYVEAMWLMLQQNKADDYVIATGETHSVKDFLVTAFNMVLGYYSDRFIEIDSALYRAAEVNYLCGDATKAQKVLSWKPKVTFSELVKRMCLSDINVERSKLNLKPLEVLHA